LLAWTCDANGSPTHTTANVLGGSRVQERKSSTEDKLEELNEQRYAKDELFGKKQRWQILTDKNGVGVWPNAPTWMRAESRLILCVPI